MYVLLRRCDEFEIFILLAACLCGFENTRRAAADLKKETWIWNLLRGFENRGQNLKIGDRISNFLNGFQISSTDLKMDSLEYLRVFGCIVVYLLFLVDTNLIKEYCDTDILYPIIASILVRLQIPYLISLTDYLKLVFSFYSVLGCIRDFFAREMIKRKPTWSKCSG